MCFSVVLSLFAYFKRQFLSDFDVIPLLKLMTGSTRIWSNFATRGPVKYLKMAKTGPKIADVGNFGMFFAILGTLKAI